MLTRQTRRGMSGIEILMISITLILVVAVSVTEVWRRAYEKDTKRRHAQENAARESAEFRNPVKGTVEVGPPENHFATDVVYRVTNLAIDEKTGLGLAWVKPEHNKGFATWHPDILRAGLGQHFKFVKESGGKKVLVLIDLKKVESIGNAKRMNVTLEDAPK